MSGGGGGGAHERGCRTGERIGDFRMLVREPESVGTLGAAAIFVARRPVPLVGTRRRTRARGLTWRPEQTRADQSKAEQARHQMSSRYEAGRDMQEYYDGQLNKANQRPCQRNETKRNEAQRRLRRLLMWLCGRRASLRVSVTAALNVRTFLSMFCAVHGPQCLAVAAIDASAVGEHVWKQPCVTAEYAGTVGPACRGASNSRTWIGPWQHRGIGQTGASRLIREMRSALGATLFPRSSHDRCLFGGR